MVRDVYYPSCGIGQLHVCRWEPERQPCGVVQIVHGIAEYVERYDAFARYLNALGYLVVAEDHMGHGKSIGKNGIKGYFHGGWFAATEDTYQLLKDTHREFPNIPYFLFGHSMGSFMVRTILVDHPDSPITGCIICGTGWIPETVLKAGLAACKAVCLLKGETSVSAGLQSLVFSGYNQKVDHPRTPYDWISRDNAVVDAYVADPMCGFTVTAGLLRDMLTGICYIQDNQNLGRMKTSLPVHFIAGGNDPVGQYGKGVRKVQKEFELCCMERLSCKIYPLCRHEILNELNRQEVFEDVGNWLENVRKKYVL